MTTNPFRAGLLDERSPDPCAIVIFGAGGDLAQRKLLPALMHLSEQGRSPDPCALVGVFRRPMAVEEFRRMVLDSAARFAPDLPLDADFQRKCAGRLHVCTEHPPEGAPYRELPALLSGLAASHGTRGNVLFYLSVPPSSFAPIVRGLAAAGLAQAPAGSWRRIIVEKPFGRDLASALQLEGALAEVFSEDQVYRIDHYMGKETVQNILVLRLANSVLEPQWNSHYVDHVQITAAESLGVENRAGYYEEAGALRDMLQNHLLQILALVAMEPPASLAPEAIRGEKMKVLEAVRPYDPAAIRQSVVCAQYAAGFCDGKPVPGYRDEPGVRADSRTDTFCALRLWVDNWRWQGVPFYLRTGKRLPKRITEVTLQFKRVPHMVFQTSSGDWIEPNALSIRIQPQEGISLKFVAKLPGHTLRLRSVDMEFRYGTSFGGRIGDAYERLLLDAMLGDPTLFARRDAVEQSWKIVMPILETWSGGSAALPGYRAGTWGPAEADALLQSDGREWRSL